MIWNSKYSEGSSYGQFIPPALYQKESGSFTTAGNSQREMFLSLNLIFFWCVFSSLTVHFVISATGFVKFCLPPINCPYNNGKMHLKNPPFFPSIRICTDLSLSLKDSYSHRRKLIINIISVKKIWYFKNSLRSFKPD